MRRVALICALVLVSCTGNAQPAQTSQPSPLTTLPAATTAGTTTTTVPTTTTVSSSTTTTTLPPNATAEFALSQVVFGDLAFVIITNWGNAPGTLDGVWLSQGSAVQDLPDVELGSGEQALLGIAQDPPPDLTGMAAVVHIGPSVGAINEAGGELALHDSDSFDDPASIICYVAWGSGPHSRSEEATEAGLWDGSSVEIVDATPSISTGIYPAVHATDWAVDIGG
jgi:hypothetical protein